MGVAASGRYVEGAKSTTLGAETLTALASTSSGTAFSVDDAIALVVTQTITAATGTSPTLVTSLECRVDASSEWYSVAAFASAGSGASTKKRAFPVAGWAEARFVKTVGGTTPSFTGTIAVSKVRN